MRLYLASIEGFDEDDLISRTAATIPASKAARCRRCRRKEARVEMLLGEALLAHALYDAFGIEVPVDERVVGAHGKPEAAGGRASACFNISHSGGYALVAVDREPIGVDIERHRPIEPGTARRFMDGAALDEWTRAGCPERFFFEHWTRRESELKMLGIGLAGLSGDAPMLPEGIASTAVEAPAGCSAAVCGRLGHGDEGSTPIAILSKHDLMHTFPKRKDASFDRRRLARREMTD